MLVHHARASSCASVAPYSSAAINRQPSSSLSAMSYSCFVFSCSRVSQFETVAGILEFKGVPRGTSWHSHAALSCLHAHKGCSDTHHHALNIQQPAREQVPLERMNITLVPGVNMVVLSGSISEKVIQSVLPKYRGYKWQCLTTRRPSRQHSDPQQKFGIDQVTVPPTPPRKDTGGGGGRNGG